MSNQKKLVLLKDLPSCPKGRIFKEDIEGDFFHSMTDEEAIEGKLKSYRFTKQEIEDNFQFFTEDHGTPKNKQLFCQKCSEIQIHKGAQSGIATITWKCTVCFSLDPID